MRRKNTHKESDAFEAGGEKWPITATALLLCSRHVGRFVREPTTISNNERRTCCPKRVIFLTILCLHESAITKKIENISARKMKLHVKGAIQAFNSCNRAANKLLHLLLD